MKKFLFCLFFIFIGSYLFAQQNIEYVVNDYFIAEDGEAFMFYCSAPMEYECKYLCLAFNPCENTAYTFISNNKNTLTIFCTKYLEATKDVRGKKSCSVFDLKMARDVDVKHLFKYNIKYKLLDTNLADVKGFDNKIVVKTCELY